MTWLQETYERNKRWLYFAFAAVFIWGMAAHGYAMLDNSFTHDSLSEFDANIFGNGHKIMLGRILVPTYRQLFRGDLTMPWFIGLLSLLWIGIAVFLVMKTFRIESKLIAGLVAGVFVANISFSSMTATYINDLDNNMFGVMCAVCAVFLWRRFSWGWLPGIAFVIGALGIYQSIILVTVTLVMIACILDILDKQTFEEVLKKGLKAVGMLLLGGILYYLLLKLQLYRSGLTMYTDEPNSLGALGKLSLQALPKMVMETYALFWNQIWNAYSSYPAFVIKGVTALLILASGLSVAVGLCSKEISPLSKVLCLILILLLPLGTAMVYILSAGHIHELMLYAVWLVYLLPLLLSDRLVKHWKKEKWLSYAASIQRIGCMILVLVILYSNVQFANTLYLRKDIEYDAYLSLMTRVVARMEEVDGYTAGETPVVFVGLPEQGRALNATVPGFEYQNGLVGFWASDVMAVPEMGRYRAYFDYVLNVPLCLPEKSVFNEIAGSDMARQMPSYPDKGFAVMQNGMLIVKLGHVE